MSNLRVLFVMDDISLLKTSGISAFVRTHLDMLIAADFCVNLLILCHQNNQPSEFITYTQRNKSDWEFLRSRLNEVCYIQLEPQVSVSQPIQNIFRSLSNPVTYLHPRLTHVVIQQFINIVEQVSPTFIWAEHRLAAILGYLAGCNSKLIYSHADWEHRIGKYRPTKKPTAIKTLRKRYHLEIMRVVERRLVRSVAGCISGSVSELKEINQLNPNTAYLPTCYEPVELKASPDLDDVRIVHFGGMGATANRVGLERFMKVTWPLLKTQCAKVPELWVVGNLDGISEGLQALLTDANAICTGFVSDLAGVFRSYDIQVIPWEYDTGTRTRIPLLLNYRQAIVAHRNAVRSTLEIFHRENGLISENLEEMALHIKLLLDNPQLRRSIADNGRSTFESNFTMNTMLPRFETFISRFYST